MEIHTIQGIFKEAPLATRLHTNQIDGFRGCLKRWPHNLSQNINIYIWLRTNRINKYIEENNSWYFHDVEGCDNEEEEDACIVSQTQTARVIPLNDLTILANSAITTSSTRMRLLSTWKSVQEQTQNLRCENWCVLSASKPFETYDKIENHIGIHIMWLETCIICLNNIINQEELISHLNIFP